MKPVVTAREMRAIDQATIRDHVAGLTLMERAGGAVAAPLISLSGAPEPGSKVVVVCGKGNNGGDGLVVARLLKRRRIGVSVYLVGKPAEVKGDALTNLKRCRRARIKVVELTKTTWKTFIRDLEKCRLVVDAIFGTGFEGEPRGLAADAIRAINACRAGKIAVDIASGVDATTGAASLAVNAHVTITMGLPKRGQLLLPGKALTGRLEVADIGIPEAVIEGAGLTVGMPEAEDALAAIPERPPDAHKWTCGHVVCICGSTGLTGAAALTSESALRAGAGLVTLAVPRSLNAIMEVKLTEVMTLPVEETSRGSFSLRAYDVLMGLAGKADCVALGPGVSQNEETAELVRALVAILDKPCVLDADGINAFAGCPDRLKKPGYPLIITPHVGEASRLFGVDKADIAARRIEFAGEKARELGVVLVLKGAPTIVAGPDGRTFVNPTGNQSLATAGSGDVLTGIIAGLVAQGAPPLEAAYCGAFVHGRCAEPLGQSLGRGLLAGEIGRRVPGVIRSLEGLRDESFYQLLDLMPSYQGLYVPPVYRKLGSHPRGGRK
jgi:hydroxyethylthiazole kinase-like uncharacterized protein yjeF